MDVYEKKLVSESDLEFDDQTPIGMLTVPQILSALSRRSEAHVMVIVSGGSRSVTYVHACGEHQTRLDMIRLLESYVSPPLSE